MKKNIKRLMAIASAALLAVGFASCGQTEKEIISAYDIAVKNGFVGTETEWLASLKGANGKNGEDLNIMDVYEAAKAEGATEDFLSFLQKYLSVEMQENNDTATIAQNVTSVVSIFCGFYKQTEQVVGRFPIYQTEQVFKVLGAAGSGVIIDLNKEAGNAYIVTNYHVLYSLGMDSEISDCIYVYPYGALNGFTTGDSDRDGVLDIDSNKDGSLTKEDLGDFGGNGVRATYVGGAMDYDIAVIKVEGSDYFKRSTLSQAVIGDSDAVTVGEKVFAIGNSNGEGVSVTSGIISVESERIPMSSMDNEDEYTYYRVMRTDAAINHGNSGGGLFDANGKLIGITNAKSIEEETDNVGYALPITQMKNLVENILDNGGVLKRATVGVVTMITDSITELVDGKLKIIETFMIDSVASGTAADGKFQKYDVFKSVTIDGTTYQLTRQHQLNDLLLKVREGDTIVLKVLRRGETETDVTIKFGAENFTLFN